MEQQPASKSYFFGKAYSDIAAVMKFAWQTSFTPIVKEAKRLGKLYKSNVFAALFTTLCDVVVFPVASALILVFASVVSAAFFVFVVIVAAGVCVLYSFVAFLDWTFCLIHGINSQCPSCQEKFRYPSYKCPSCGAVHTRLRPSKYGILTRKCRCGQKLHTTFFNGRQRLTAVCTHCNSVLKDGGRHVEITIPVVGGANCGKTVFVTSAIMQLQQSAPRNGLDFAYSPIAGGDDYGTNSRLLSQGCLPQKTHDTRMRYYQFYLSPKGAKIKNLVSLCDVAGEAYTQMSELDTQAGYKNADAYMIILDPLSVAGYRNAVKSRIDLSKYRFSSKPMDEVLGMLTAMLENTKCLDAKDMVKADAAVVFTKCDIPGLDDLIGKPAVRRYMQNNLIASEYDAQNALCESFLETYNEQNFLNNLKSKFKSVQFFTCSALGHVADGRRFTPTGVDEPLLWLVDKASKSINLEEKWGKKI